MLEHFETWKASRWVLLGQDYAAQEDAAGGVLTFTNAVPSLFFHTEDNPIDPMPSEIGVTHFRCFLYRLAPVLNPS